MFAITRFHYIEVFSIHFNIARAEIIVLYTEDFVFIEVR